MEPDIFIFIRFLNNKDKIDQKFGKEKRNLDINTYVVLFSRIKKTID